DVGDAAKRRDELAVVVAVAGGVVPAGFSLDQGNAQVVHGSILPGSGVVRLRWLWCTGFGGTPRPGAGGYRFSRVRASCPGARAIHPCIACRDTPGARSRLTSTAISAASSGSATRAPSL